MLLLLFLMLLLLLLSILELWQAFMMHYNIIIIIGDPRRP